MVAVRVSSTKQYQQGDSPKEQMSSAKNRANELSAITIGAVEYAQSASEDVPFENQPLKQAIDKCKDQFPTAGYLIIKDIERSTRAGGEVFKKIKQYAKSLNILLMDSARVISHDTVDAFEHLGYAGKYKWTEDSTSEVYETIEADRAKVDRKRILRRLIGSQLFYAEYGFAVHPAPFGYIGDRIEGSHGKRYIYKPHPEESKWIIRAYELRAEGLKTDDEIIEIINGMGYKSRIQMVRDELGNPIGKRGGVVLTKKQLKKMLTYTNYAGVNNKASSGQAHEV